MEGKPTLQESVRIITTALFKRTELTGKWKLMGDTYQMTESPRVFSISKVAINNSGVPILQLLSYPMPGAKADTQYKVDRQGTILEIDSMAGILKIDVQSYFVELAAQLSPKRD